MDKEDSALNIIMNGSMTKGNTTKKHPMQEKMEVKEDGV